MTDPPARAPRDAAVLHEIGAVCMAVAHGLPTPPRAPFTIVKLRRYAAGAAAPERRLAVSLARMQRLGDTRRVRALSRAWNNSRALLLELDAPTKGAAATAAIGDRIQASAAILGALADRYGLPTCGGVAPR